MNSVNRLSTASNSDTFHPPSAGFDTSTLDSATFSAPRQRHDSNTLLMLPAPLAVNRGPMSSAASSTAGVSRSSEDVAYSDNGSGSNLRLVASPHSLEHYSDNDHSPGRRYTNTPPPPPPHDRPNTRSSMSMSHETSGSSNGGNPFYTTTTSPQPYEESDEAYRAGGRGVRLTDSGPVPGPEGVRRVARPAGRRPTSQAPPQNRYSRNSTVYSLPPGAAAPQTGGGYGQ